MAKRKKTKFKVGNTVCLLIDKSLWIIMSLYNNYDNGHVCYFIRNNKGASRAVWEDEICIIL